MSYRLILTVALILILGCSSSSADLNKIAQDSIKSNKELKEYASTLDNKYLGVNKETIIAIFGKPRKKSNEPYPYKLDINCYGKNCAEGHSDEIWFYEFKRKSSSGWEAYSVYVYFKENVVVRIR
jgi:hypothetical protein